MRTDKEVDIVYNRFIERGGYELLWKLWINKKKFAKRSWIIEQNLKSTLLWIKRSWKPWREITKETKRKIVNWLDKTFADIFVNYEFIYKPIK